MELKTKALFNEKGDIDVQKRRMINGNTTNLNDFNHMKYQWVHDWYRQAMNNFWIPEEINLLQDIKDYRLLKDEERTAYDKRLNEGKNEYYLQVLKQQIIKLGKKAQK